MGRGRVAADARHGALAPVVVAGGVVAGTWDLDRDDLRVVQARRPELLAEWGLDLPPALPGEERLVDLLHDRRDALRRIVTGTHRRGAAAGRDRADASRAVYGGPATGGEVSVKPAAPDRWFWFEAGLILIGLGGFWGWLIQLGGGR